MVRSSLIYLLALPILLGIFAKTAAACPGDCNGSGTLTAADITRLVALVLLCDGNPSGCPAAPRACPNGDSNDNGRIDIGDIIAAINQILEYPTGCPPTPTPSATRTPETPPSVTPSWTAMVTPSATEIPPPTPTWPSPSPSNTTVPSPTPSPTPAPAVCGNGVVEPPETCDDGNTVTNPPADVCPEDCTIVTCTPSGARAEIAVNFSSPVGVASIAVLIEYPDGTVQIPGTGDDQSVGARVLSRPSGFLATFFDFDYALRVGLAGTRAITGAQLFRIQFDVCRDAPVPPATAYRCRVLEANNTSFQPISGVTCNVTIP